MTLRRIAHRWLFWLALVLPIAQAMVGVHVLSHVSGERPDDGIAHLVHCDLCLTAADLASGAPTPELTPLVAGVSGEVRAVAPGASVVERAAEWRPPARAPPQSA